MLSGKRILAVVPARGGSKGVPLKNLHPLLGRPLIEYVGDVVREANVFDRAVVSTDHEEIARAADAVGLAAPFRRPESLSGDQIGDWDVLHHALLEMERLDAVRYDVVVMLQPTSPLRLASHVVESVEKLIETGFDSVWTVSPTDFKYHPLKQLAMDAAGHLDFFDPRGAQIIARQQLSPVYTRNGASYAFSRRCLVEEKTTMARRSGAVVTKGAMVSIDSVEDFAIVEAVLRQRAAGRQGAAL